MYYKFDPRPDFAIIEARVDGSYLLPRLAVEINSTIGNANPTDRFRLFLQAASIVRLANATQHKEKQDFVFVAIYIRDDALVERHLVFQKPDADNRVSRYIHAPEALSC